MIIFLKFNIHSYRCFSGVLAADFQGFILAGVLVVLSGIEAVCIGIPGVFLLKSLLGAMYVSRNIYVSEIYERLI